MNAKNLSTGWSRLLLTMLALLAAALVAAGCGEDDSSSDDGAKKSAAESQSEKSDEMDEKSDEMDEKMDDKMAAKDIVDTAVGAGDFTTLVAAVQAAGLEETLRGDGPFTVFAPTDEAFAKLPEGTLEDLLKPENKQKLADILTYHVVSGAAVKSSDLTDGQMVDTVQGGKLKVSLANGVKIGDATVVTPDIESSNGVIHVIDTVLLPPAS